jgi:hypothetical protein
MITVASIIDRIRSKTGDTDPLKYRYSDMEIVDGVNDALDMMSEELLWSTRTWQVPCQDGVGRYALPTDFLRPISASYNGETIHDIVSFEARLQNEDRNGGMAYDNRTFHLFPATGVKSGDVVELYYNNYEHVNDATDTLAFASGFRSAIVYCTLHMLYQNPISKDHMKKSSEYLSLYYARLPGLKSRARSNVQSKRLRSGYRKV